MVAEGVVHRLEVVEVQHQHSVPPASASGPSVRLGEPVLEEDTVGEPCERVVQCLMGQLGTESPLLGDVPDRDDEVERRPGRVARSGLRHLDNDQPPVLVHVAVDVHPGSLVGR